MASFFTIIQTKVWQRKEIDSIQGISLDHDKNLYLTFFNDKERLVVSEVRREDLQILRVDSNKDMDVLDRDAIYAFLQIRFVDSLGNQHEKALTLSSSLRFQGQLDAALLHEIFVDK